MSVQLLTKIQGSVEFHTQIHTCITTLQTKEKGKLLWEKVASLPFTIKEDEESGFDGKDVIYLNPKQIPLYATRGTDQKIQFFQASLLRRLVHQLLHFLHSKTGDYHINELNTLPGLYDLEEQYTITGLLYSENANPLSENGIAQEFGEPIRLIYKDYSE